MLARLSAWLTRPLALISRGLRLPARASGMLAVLSVGSSLVALAAGRLALGAGLAVAALFLYSAFVELSRPEPGSAPDETVRVRASLVGRGSMFRNVVAGALATGADFVVVAVLVELASVSPVLATALGCGVGAVTNFSINRVWAFGSIAPKVAQAGRYAFVSASSAALNSGLVALLLLLPATPYQLAWLLARAAVYLAWNFPLHRDYVFTAADAASRA